MLVSIHSNNVGMVECWVLMLFGYGSHPGPWLPGAKRTAGKLGLAIQLAPEQLVISSNNSQTSTRPTNCLPHHHHSPYLPTSVQLCPLFFCAVAVAVLVSKHLRVVLHFICYPNLRRCSTINPPRGSTDKQQHASRGFCRNTPPLPFSTVSTITTANTTPCHILMNGSSCIHTSLTP